MSRIGDALRHTWNIFSSQEQARLTSPQTAYYGASAGRKPDRTWYRVNLERSIVSSIYTRIAIDGASIAMRHVRLDDQDRYEDDMDSGLNECLTLRANIDQAATAFSIDVIMSMLDEGCVAIVPVDTSIDPGNTTGGFDIQSMRVGKIVQWYPNHVRVLLFKEDVQRKVEITLPKTMVAIVENPLYSVMNEPNSTLQRLLYKLSLLDAVDEQSASGKLDLIIQLPYVIKSEARRQQAEQRRSDIEFQLKGSQYGIAYTDGTEKITQLNRPAENNLMTQIEYLTQMLYGQLGITEEVMNGTANEKTMLNYWNRTVEPILTAICESMQWSFLTKTARTQGQSVMYFRDPFRLIPIENIAKIADVFSRNEILSANEMRQVIGFRPSKEKLADKLHNSNMPAAKQFTDSGTIPVDPAATGSNNGGPDPTGILNENG